MQKHTYESDLNQKCHSVVEDLGNIDEFEEFGQSMIAQILTVLSQT